MSPNCGAIAALGFLSVVGYLFWRGTVGVMNARRLVSTGALLTRFTHICDAQLVGA
jgi:hypothetical protein